MASVPTIIGFQPRRTPRAGFAKAVWLDSPGFDTTLVLGTAAIAVAAGAAVFLDPELFPVLLFADLWLLGYHHVAATYARIATEQGGFRRYRALVTWLPIVVALGTVAITLGIGLWTLPTIYLYWQWWHYTRQSYGVGQMFRLKSGQQERSLNELKLVIYTLPLAGILYRSYQAPHRFLGMPLRVIPVPVEAIEVAVAVAALTLLWWSWRQIRAWRAGELPLAYTAYLASHVAIFAVGYFVFENINHGWLVINVWHNSQYIGIVWLFNHKRFGNHVDPSRRLISSLTLRRNVGFYLMAILGVATIAHTGITGLHSLLPGSVLTLPLVTYQAMNFHHYIVDSAIWKIRKPQIRDSLGLETPASSAIETPSGELRLAGER